MIPKAPLSVALVHHPVYDAHQKVVSTSITPFDLHDIARIAKTYGIYRYFVVCPVETQRRLAQRIMDHWLTGVGGELNGTRKAAFELIRLVDTLEQARLTIQGELARAPRLIATSARTGPGRLGFPQMQAQLAESPDPHCLIFGTGWGLTEECLAGMDGILEPVAGGGDGSYNHLSVRSAVAIILDRLLGRNHDDACAS